MNITKLPFDIHGLIYDNLKDGRDIYNFKNTCKTFKNYVGNEIPLNVILFKMKYKIIFNNCDINKHSLICKKMSNILENFNLYEIHFNRTHNSCKSIFDTQTVIYVSMFTDNVKEHKNKLYKLLNQHNLTNYYINFDIVIYFTDNFIDIIINHYNKNNNDIIISNQSLQKITESDMSMCIHEYQKIIDKYYNHYVLNSDKLYINKCEMMSFLIYNMKLQEKEIEQGLRLMEERYYDENFIKNKMNKLDVVVSKLNKFRNKMILLEKNIQNNQKDKVKRRLEAEFMMIE